MQIQIQTAPLKVDDSILDNINNKLEKLQRFYERIEKCHVLLKEEKADPKKGFIVEVRMAVPKNDLFAIEGAESFGHALDLVVADLKKQLIKHKEKMNEVHGAEKPQGE